MRRIVTISLVTALALGGASCSSDDSSDGGGGGGGSAAACDAVDELSDADSPEDLADVVDELEDEAPDELADAVDDLDAGVEAVEQYDDASSDGSEFVDAFEDGDDAIEDLATWAVENCDLAEPPWACWFDQAASAKFDEVGTAIGGSGETTTTSLDPRDPEEAAAEAVDLDDDQELVELDRDDEGATFAVVEDGLRVAEVEVTRSSSGGWRTSTSECGSSFSEPVEKFESVGEAIDEAGGTTGTSTEFEPVEGAIGADDPDETDAAALPAALPSIAAITELRPNIDFFGSVTPEPACDVPLLGGEPETGWLLLDMSDGLLTVSGAVGPAPAGGLDLIDSLAPGCTMVIDQLPDSVLQRIEPATVRGVPGRRLVWEAEDGSQRAVQLVIPAEGGRFLLLGVAGTPDVDTLISLLDQVAALPPDPEG